MRPFQSLAAIIVGDLDVHDGGHSHRLPRASRWTHLAFLTALLAGILFGSGLLLSRMCDPQRVLAFLDVAGEWSPALAFTMGGAILIAAPGVLVRAQPSPQFAGRGDRSSRPIQDQFRFGCRQRHLWTRLGPLWDLSRPEPAAADRPLCSIGRLRRRDDCGFFCAAVAVWKDGRLEQVLP
jgi:hypothetical protein